MWKVLNFYDVNVISNLIFDWIWEKYGIVPIWKYDHLELWKWDHLIGVDAHIYEKNHHHSKKKLR